MSLTRNKMMVAGGAEAATGQRIINSLRFDGSGYLSRTPSSASNRKTWTWSGWLKRGRLNAAPGTWLADLLVAETDPTSYFSVRLNGSTKLNIIKKTSGVQDYSSFTTPIYKDVSSWYHIVVAFDTTQSTAADRVKYYVNGKSAAFLGSLPSLNSDEPVNNTIAHKIGGIYFDGYLAEVNFIDGQRLTPDDFAVIDTSSGQWVAKKYTGTYGTNGFYLDFSGATLGADNSGNSNDFTAHNLTSDNQTLDTPTNNFATLNPYMTTGTNYTYSEGNLKYSTTSFRNGCTTNNIAMTSGKWYWEIVMTTNGSTAATHLGVVGMEAGIDHLDSYNPRSVYQPGTGNLYQSGNSTATLTSSAVGDIIGFALDVDSNELSIYKNNSSILSGHSLPANSDGGWLVQLLGEGLGNTMEGVVNFGQNSSFAGNKTAQGNGGTGEDFYYTPPTGYKALNTKNLPDPEIALPNEHFNTVRWSGDATASRDIAGLNFSPDFVWTKERDVAIDNLLYDTIRGASTSVTSNAMSSNTTAAEGTQNDNTQFGFISAFNSDGFSVTNGSRADVSYVNKSGGTYVAWNWKAGGTASSNTDGTITSTVSANTTAGFSIVKYTGTGVAGDTMGHGLSQAPEMVIMKKRVSNGADGLRGWRVWTKDLTDGNYLALHATNAQFGARDFGEVGNATYPYTPPTASLITFGGVNTGQYQEVNYSGDDYIMYCFHSVDGYSKVGTYIGNAAVPYGRFVYTGFSPAFLMIKRIDSADYWGMWDNKRIGYNYDNRILRANVNSAEEAPGSSVDLLTNGFRCTSNMAANNANGGIYIYLAFADLPFKYSNAR